MSVINALHILLRNENSIMTDSDLSFDFTSALEN